MDRALASPRAKSLRLGATTDFGTDRDTVPPTTHTLRAARSQARTRFGGPLGRLVASGTHRGEQDPFAKRRRRHEVISTAVAASRETKDLARRDPGISRVGPVAQAYPTGAAGRIHVPTWITNLATTVILGRHGT